MEKEVLVKWTVREPETARILGLLEDLVLESRNEQGNILYAVYQSESDPNVLFLHERYTDEAAMELHKNSAHYLKTVVGQIIPHLESREVQLLHKLY